MGGGEARLPKFSPLEYLSEIAGAGAVTEVL